MKNTSFVSMVLGLGAVVLGLTLFSCKGKPKLLTEAEMTTKVNQMYADQALELEARMDSMCTANMDTYVQMAVDSIMAANTPTLNVESK